MGLSEITLIIMKEISTAQCVSEGSDDSDPLLCGSFYYRIDAVNIKLHRFRLTAQVH
jgi:hypothetical protein